MFVVSIQCVGCPLNVLSGAGALGTETQGTACAYADILNA